MDGTLFLVTMIGVAWVVIWGCVDHTKSGPAWWPFDLRSNDAPEAKGQPSRRRATSLPSTDPPRPWRRSRS